MAGQLGIGQCVDATPLEIIPSRHIALEVVVTHAAAGDLEWIAQYIAHFNPTAARRISKALTSALLSLASFPERGRLRSDGARELVAVTPYIIVYDLSPTRVTVLRVWHGAQNRL